MSGTRVHRFRRYVNILKFSFLPFHERSLLQRAVHFVHDTADGDSGCFSFLSAIYYLAAVSFRYFFFVIVRTQWRHA